MIQPAQLTDLRSECPEVPVRTGHAPVRARKRTSTLRRTSEASATHYRPANYVEWHMREAWRELMFADEDREAKRARDPVAPAKRSAAAERKAVSHQIEDGTPAHSFLTLIAELATIVRNTCVTPTAEQSATFDIVTRPNPKQQRALELLQTIQL